jgi:Cactus-binding C-terminus of cactin protein
MPQVFWWHEKYKPRKPKYFNRVHTGYEWNKYNQTHYDHDNPPPKTVQVWLHRLCVRDLSHPILPLLGSCEAAGASALAVQ